MTSLSFIVRAFHLMSVVGALSNAPGPAFGHEPAFSRPATLTQARYVPALPSTLTSSGFNTYPTAFANSSDITDIDSTGATNIDSVIAVSNEEGNGTTATQPNNNNTTNPGDDFATRRARKAEENRRNTATDTRRSGYHPDGFNQPVHCPPNAELGYMILECKDCGGGGNYGNGAFEHLWRCFGVTEEGAKWKGCLCFERINYRWIHTAPDDDWTSSSSGEDADPDESRVSSEAETDSVDWELPPGLVRLE